MNRLTLWHKHVFKKDFIYKCQTTCIYNIPSLKCIILNLNNNEVKYILSSLTSLELITNQKPVFYTAKSSIAAFKLRQGAVIGCKVTLRKKHLFDFLDLFIFLAMPKIANFNGFFLSNLTKNSLVNIGLVDLSIFIQLHKYSERFQKQSGCTVTFIANNAVTYLNQVFLLNSFQIPQKK